jgi:hypothetical protein
MAGHSRPKDGVASLAYVPAIHALLFGDGGKTWMPAFAGMTQMRGAGVRLTRP